MTDQTQTEDAREAGDMGEKPDLGRTPDALIEALSGTDSGSDTRAGSLQGGAATGSDDDPDQDRVNELLATEGMASPDSVAAPPAEPSDVRNTGDDEAASSGPDRGDADAATG